MGREKEFNEGKNEQGRRVQTTLGTKAGWLEQDWDWPKQKTRLALVGLAQVGRAFGLPTLEPPTLAVFAIQNCQQQF